MARNSVPYGYVLVKSKPAFRQSEIIHGRCRQTLDLVLEVVAEVTDGVAGKIFEFGAKSLEDAGLVFGAEDFRRLGGENGFSASRLRVEPDAVRPRRKLAEQLPGLIHRADGLVAPSRCSKCSTSARSARRLARVLPS